MKLFETNLAVVCNEQGRQLILFQKDGLFFNDKIAKAQLLLNISQLFRIKNAGFFYILSNIKDNYV